MYRSLLLVAAALSGVVAQPPPPPGGGGGGGPPMTTSGSSTATGCPSVTTCSKDGSSAYAKRYLSYNTNTGKFKGYVITNTCPGRAADYSFTKTDGTTIVATQSNTPSCTNQTFPAPAYLNPPIAAPLRGRIGLTLSDLVNIYGPMDAGFTAGFLCTNGLGQCPGGSDLDFCEADIERQCGTAYFPTPVLSDCGGHAEPYHFHCHLKCEYSELAAGHSPLVGILLDGRGLYGINEGTDTMPMDLDACGGHYGPVPATTVGEETYPAAQYVYHYHVQHKPPYFAGCFGPVTSMSQAKALYPSCTANGTCTGQTNCKAGNVYSACTAKGYSQYVLDCPVYEHMPSGEKFNQIVPTESCPVCHGNCATGGASVTPSPTATNSGSTPSPSASSTTTVSATVTASLGSTPSPTGTSAPTSDVVPTSTSTAGSVPTSTSTVGAATPAATGAVDATPSPTSSSTGAGGSVPVTTTPTTSAAAVAATPTPTRTTTPSSTTTPSTSPAPQEVVVAVELGLRPAAAPGQVLSSGAAAGVRDGLSAATGYPVIITAIINGVTGERLVVGRDDPVNAPMMGRRLVASDATTVQCQVIVPPASVAAANGDTSALVQSVSSSVTAALSNPSSSLASVSNTYAAALGVAPQPLTVESLAVQSPAGAAATTSKDGGAIGGGVGGAILAIALILVVACFIRRRQRRTAAVAKMVTRNPVSAQDASKAGGAYGAAAEEDPVPTGGAGRTDFKPAPVATGV